TVTAAISDDRRYLLVHVLDLADEAQLVADIKRRYERPLMEIFP
ncbi:MAG: Na+/H+ antiporter subunit E, partial [Gammaproteobacteria bacterium]|nr:Na+/H+ antiporter subunit E [Gammaproteobacteria bacterium]